MTTEQPKGRPDKVSRVERALRAGGVTPEEVRAYIASLTVATPTSAVTVEMVQEALQRMGIPEMINQNLAAGIEKNVAALAAQMRAAESAQPVSSNGDAPMVPTTGLAVMDSGGGGESVWMSLAKAIAPALAQAIAARVVPTTQASFFGKEQMEQVSQAIGFFSTLQTTSLQPFLQAMRASYSTGGDPLKLIDALTPPKAPDATPS